MVASHLKGGRVEDSSEDELRLADAVLAAFCFQSESPKRRKPMDVQAVYRVFAELRPKYPAWLQDMRFTYGPADTVPISGALEDILFDLGASGIMAVENPRYKYLRIPPSRLKLIRQAIVQRRSETEQDELRQLADEFSEQYSQVVKKKRCLTP
jgi:hypothetical protein